MLTALIAPIGNTGNAEETFQASVSYDDRYLAFVSNHDLQDQYPDSNGGADVFVRDNVTGALELISRAEGAAVHGFSPSISADGRYVAFVSDGANIIPGYVHRNRSADIYVYDRVNETFNRVSIPPPGETHRFPGQFSRGIIQEWIGEPSISADGKRVLFEVQAMQSNLGNGTDVYVRDIEAGATFLVSRSSSTRMITEVSMSADGKRVALLHFESFIQGDFNNAGIDIFDISSATPTLLRSVSMPGRMKAAPHAAISPDRQSVFYFRPDATGQRGDIRVMAVGDGSDLPLVDDVEMFNEDSGMAVSADSQRLVFSNGGTTFLFDRPSAMLSMLSHDYQGFERAKGRSIEPTISGNGRRVYFMNDDGRLRREDEGSADSRFDLYRSEDLNFGTITGNIFNDANGNSLHDPGEAARAGGLVYLDANNNQQFDGAERLVVADSQGQYLFKDVAPGTYTVRQLVGANVGSYPQPDSQFDIDLVFDDSIPEVIRAGVRAAADRWMDIVIGDLPDVGGIDDVEILVNSAELADAVLAVAGPDQFRSGEAGNLPYHGVLTFDLASLNSPTDRAMDIAIHEIAHVLGFGTMWEQLKLTEVIGGVPVYTGQAAVAMFKLAAGNGASAVLIEPDADNQQEGAHWASSWAIAGHEYEVMSPVLDNTLGLRHLSPVTVGAIQDLGYRVNYGQADFTGAMFVDDYLSLRRGASVSADSSGYSVTIGPGRMEGGLDFGVRPASVTFPFGPKPTLMGTISGLAFIDTNGNRRKDKNEKNLRCTIFFDSDKDGVLDAGEPRIKLRSSSYQFTNVPLGIHKIGVVLPKGFKLAPKLKAVKVTVAKLGAKLNIIARRA
jgi:Tol biopolymer transport system component